VIERGKKNSLADVWVRDKERERELTGVGKPVVALLRRGEASRVGCSLSHRSGFSLSPSDHK
jgi:hypothetical protein